MNEFLNGSASRDCVLVVRSLTSVIVASSINATPAATAAAASTATSSATWLDPEETSIRKRLPASYPKRNIDLYITNKTHPKAQFERCQQLIHSGETEIYLHSLGAAIPKALNLALKIKKLYGDEVSLDTATNTIELTDDFEKVTGDSNNRHSRYNSAVYIKIIHKTVSAEPEEGITSTSSEQ